MQTFTSNDLLLYVLNECSDEQNALIQNAIETNSDIKKEVENLQLSIQEISTISFSPNPKTMDKILSKLHLESDVVVV